MKVRVAGASHHVAVVRDNQGTEQETAASGRGQTKAPFRGLSNAGDPRGKEVTTTVPCAEMAFGPSQSREHRVNRDAVSHPVTSRNTVSHSGRVARASQLSDTPLARAMCPRGFSLTGVALGASLLAFAFGVLIAAVAIERDIARVQAKTIVLIQEKAAAHKERADMCMRAVEPAIEAVQLCRDHLEAQAACACWAPEGGAQ